MNKIVDLFIDYYYITMSQASANGYTWRYFLDASNNATIGTSSYQNVGNATTLGTDLSGAIIIPSALNGSTVTGIGEYAFQNCNKLRSLTMPNSLTTILNFAFVNCTGLTSVPISDMVKNIGSQCFVNCTGLTSVTIGNSVTIINSQAFFGCSGLTSVTIGNSVTSIDQYVFGNCTGLTSLTIPDSVKTIGNTGAFINCSGLMSVTIGNSVTNIGASTFQGCTGLTSINIPDSVTSIGANAFLNTSANFTITMNTKTIGGTTYTSPTAPGPDITFFGNTSVTLVEPPQPPNMTITSTTTGVTSGSTTNNTPIALTFTSTRETGNFVETDIAVSNGTLSNFAGSGAVYTATFTPNGQGPVACTINVAANVYSDAVGNNTASDTFTFIFDAAPTMAITSTTVTSGSTTNVQPINLTFTASESITGFTRDDISFNNGTLSGLTVSSDTVYTATFTPTIQGAYTINVPVGAYIDASGNANTAASSFNWTYDAAPTMTITSTIASGSISNIASIPLTFTASETITGFQAVDVSFNKGGLTAFSGSGSVYNATFTQGGQGAHTIYVPVGAYVDASGNANTAVSSFNWTYDSVSPTMDISSTTVGVTIGSTTKTTPIELRFTSTEATTNFQEVDISFNNGTLSNFAAISSTVYTATFTPTSPGPVACTIDVLAGAYTDAATNLNNLATQFAFTYDSVPPTMAITSSTIAAGSTTNAPIALTFTSNKATANFLVGDISVTNGTLSGFASSSSTVYTATFAPTSQGVCTIAVAANKFTDAVENNNAASNTFSFGYIPKFAAFNDANNLEQTYIAGFLDVSGEVIHRTRDLTVIDGKLIVSSGNVALNTGNLYVAGNGVVNSSLMVTGPTTLRQIVASTNVDVSGATTLVGAVSVAGLTTFNNNVGIANNKKFTVGSGATVLGGDVSMNSTLKVAGDVSLNSTLSVTGLTTLANTSIVGTLVVNGKSTFTTDMSFVAVDVDICGNLRAQYPANSIPLSAIKGGGSLTAADVSMNAGLSVAGATTASTLTAKGNTAIGGALAVTGAATLAALTSTGAVAVGDTLVVTEKTVFGTDVSFNGSRVDICGNLYANYPANSIPASAVISSGSTNTFITDLSMNANLSIAGATTFASTMVVAGKTTFLNDVSLGFVSGSRVDICGNLYAIYAANSIPQSAIIGGVGNVFNTDVSMNARLSVKNNINIDSAQMQYKDLSWNQVGRDIDGQPGSLSGMAASLSNDGSRVAIGNRLQALPIRVYTRDLSNATIGWSQLGGDISLNPVGDTYYAHHVVLSGDGSVVAVYMYSPLGSIAGGTAKALVFQFQSGSWVKLGNTLNTGSARGGNGIALSNDGLTIAVGAPQTSNAYANDGGVVVYRYNGSSWIQLGGIIAGNAGTGFFGWSVALSSDGNIVAGGAAGTTSSFAGYVAVYSYNGSSWNQLGASLTGTASSRFGSYVSLSADGTILAASSGVQTPTYARVYRYTGSWTQVGTDITQPTQGAIDGGTIYIGLPISLSRDGTILAMGTYTNDGTSTDVNNNIGATLVYRCPVGSSTWTQIGNTILGETSGDYSGSSVALSGDGSFLAIGAINNDGTYTSTTNNSGQVRIYNRGVRVAPGLDISANVIPTSLTTSTLTIGSTLNVSGATTLATLTSGSANVGGTLRVTGASATATLTSGNTNVGGTLYLTGATTFPADASLNSTLTVTSDVSVNSTLTVASDVSFNSTLYVNREVSLNSTLFVTGATTLAGAYASTLSVTGATTMADTAYITGNSTIVGVLAFALPYTFAADASLNLKLTVARDVSLNATLNVTGATTLSTLTIPTNMTLNSTLSVTGASTIALDVSANARLLVIGAATLSSTVSVATTTNLAGTMQVTGATTASTLTASGATTIGGTLTVNGKTSIAGTTTFNSTTVDVSGNLRASSIGFPTGSVVVQNKQIADWVKIGDDIDGEATPDQSGWSTALSADGSIVAIGAYLNDGTSGIDRGHVRVYQRNATNTTVAPIGWTQLGGDIDGEAASDQSGYSVSLSADGLTVAIGANLNDGTTGVDRGHVRVYKYNAPNWTQLGNDIDGENADDRSGISVSLSANGLYLAIGATQNDGTTGTLADVRGHVRIYQYVSPSWTQVGGDIDGEAAGDGSGISVSLLRDPTSNMFVAIGANLNDGTVASASDNRGHVRVYQYDVNKGSADTLGPAKWNRLGADIDGEVAGDGSGQSVSLAIDQSSNIIVAIGANINDGTTASPGDNRGHVRVYQYQAGKAADTNQSNPTFGPLGWKRLGADIDGEFALDESGYSVSLSGNGSIIAIGGYKNDGTSGVDRGHVKVYQYQSGTNAWSQLGTDIDGEAASDQSGYSVSLSSDGLTVAIGANLNDGTNPGVTTDNRGHVRVFKCLPSGLYTNSPLIVTNAITTGNVTLFDAFNVTRATSLTGTLSVAGVATVSTINTSSNASVGGGLTVSGATTSTGTLNVSGATTSTTMSLSSNAVIGGTLIVSGAATMQTLNITGPIKKC